MGSSDDLHAEVERLREALHSQQNFLAVITHELRNPLGPLLIGVEALLEEVQHGQVSQPMLLRRLAMLRRYATRLRDDLDRLNDFSRLRRGHIELHLEQLDLSELVAHVLDEMAAMLRAHECTVELALASRLIGRWDALRLRQVIWNLASNAAKYASGSRITIRTFEQAQWAVLEIRDRGRGIAESDREAVFRKFERTGSHTGLGVGLWLVRTIVEEAFGGVIQLESEVDVGTTIVVKLPRKR